MSGREICYNEIGRLIDVSAVKTDVTQNEIDAMIRLVRQYHCICASPMPWATKYTIEKLSDCDDAVVTGVVGFPSGADTTHIKVKTAEELLRLGCRELDMVLNVSALLSGQWDYVREDISAVIQTAGSVPVKVILEICYLTDEEIQRASVLAAEAGAAYIKTGTGWGPRPTTPETIRLIRSAIGDTAKIKAAGGVRNLETLEEMYREGCDRFGLGVRTAEKILKEAAAKK